MPFPILNWLDIAANFSHTLLVGNGGSVAVHDEFGYTGLFEAAQVHGFINANVADIFERFGTNDFELVLRRLWQAKQVNTALDITVKEVEDAYATVRTALIQTVQKVHVSYDEAKPHLDPIYRFMRGFQTVVSLNYDLLIYWAAQYGNDALGSRYHFKDGFNRSSFSDDWQMYRGAYGGVSNPTIFCYPHGNIALGVSRALEEEKLIAGAESLNLLDSIIGYWRDGSRIPLFICDGRSEQKLETILKSPYLRSVYGGPLSDIGESLVIYGWGIGSQEHHILERIARSRPQRVAVSVYDGMQAYCEHAYYALSKIGVGDIMFFHSNSEGAWNNSSGA